MIPNRRESSRTNCSLPVEISMGSQVIIQGQIKDISLKSAFIKLKSSVYMQPNDELNFLIKRFINEIDNSIAGAARISRILTGEGIAIYFTRMDEASMSRLQEMVNN